MLAVDINKDQLHNIIIRIVSRYKNSRLDIEAKQLFSTVNESIKNILTKLKWSNQFTVDEALMVIIENKLDMEVFNHLFKLHNASLKANHLIELSSSYNIDNDKKAANSLQAFLNECKEFIAPDSLHYIAEQGEWELVTILLNLKITPNKFLSNIKDSLQNEIKSIGFDINLMEENGTFTYNASDTKTHESITRSKYLEKCLQTKNKDYITISLKPSMIKEVNNLKFISKTLTEIENDLLANHAPPSIPTGMAWAQMTLAQRTQNPQPSNQSLG